MIKICHISDRLPEMHKIWGGAEQVCLSIIRLLAQEEFYRVVKSGGGVVANEPNLIYS